MDDHQRGFHVNYPDLYTTNGARSGHYPFARGSTRGLSCAVHVGWTAAAKVKRADLMEVPVFYFIAPSSYFGASILRECAIQWGLTPVGRREYGDKIGRRQIFDNSFGGPNDDGWVDNSDRRRWNWRERNISLAPINPSLITIHSSRGYFGE